MKHICVGFFLFFSVTVFGEARVLHALLDSSGKPFGHVDVQVHDRHGFHWFAGGALLSRFDGYHLESVLDRIVDNVLFVDSRDRLWVSGTYSLIQVDTISNKISYFDRLESEEHFNQKINVNDIKESVDGLLIVATDYGLSVFDESSQSLVHYSAQVHIDGVLQHTPVTSFEFIDDKTLILGTKFGVYRLPINELFTFNQGDFELENKSTTNFNVRNFESKKVLTPANLVLNESFGSQEFTKDVVILDNSRFVFVNKNGFTYFDEATQNTRRYQNVSGSSELKDHTIKSVYRLNSTQLMLGTLQGLNLFNIETLSLSSAESEFVFAAEDNGLRINHIYEANSILYISTSLGVYWTALDKQELDADEQYSQKQEYDNSINSSFNWTHHDQPSLDSVWSIIESKNHGLILGSYGLGVFFLNDDGGVRQARQSSGELASDNVAALHEDSEGGLWVGTIGGVSYSSSQTEPLKPFALPEGIPKHGSYKIRTIVSGQDGTIWMLATDWLAQLDADNNLIQLYDFNKMLDAKCQNYASTFILIETKALIGCENGLLILDIESKRVLSKINTQVITRILKDQQSNIWVLSATQLYLFDANAVTLAPVQSEGFFENISSDGFFNMLEDPYSQLWIAYPGGMLVFDTTSKVFIASYAKGTQFDKQQVLFGQDSMRLSSSGNILLGEVKGLVSFKPIPLKRPKKPRIVISKIEETYGSVGDDLNDTTFNKKQKEYDIKISALPFSSVSQPLGKPISYAHLLQKIQFEFSDLSLKSTEQELSETTYYQYYLQGVENNWRKLSDQRSVSYPALREGEYTLHVRSFRNLQFSDELSYTFIVRSHPLLSTLAKSIYTFIVCVFFVFLLKVRSYSLQKKVERLESSVGLRTKELVDKNKYIENLLADKKIMIENVFHQTRTPIQLFIANMDDLKAGHLEIPMYVEKQAKNIQDLVELTDRILTNSSNSLVLNYQNIDILLSQFIDKYTYMAQKKGLIIHDEISTPITLVTNVQCLSEIIDNLLSNSIKYTQVGHIVVRMYIENKHFVLVVQDTGLGIARENIAHVFDRRFRENKDVSGHGVGLSIVKDNVDSLHGDITIESTVGEGSCVRVTLPINLSEGEIDVKTHESLVDVTLPVNNLDATSIPIDGLIQQELKDEILLVEDNQELATFYKKVLQEHYCVNVVSSGEEAISMAIREVPNLVLSDVMMGGITGYDVVNTLKQNPVTRHIPIILLTAKADYKSKLYGFQLGANDYIVKPVQPYELHLRVRNQLSLVRSVESHNMIPATTEVSHECTDEISRKFLWLIESDFSNSELNSEHIAQELNITKKQLERKIKQVLGTTPKQYLIEYRLRYAKGCLSRGDKASKVFDICGFSSHAYFSNKFKEKYHCTPSEYALMAKPSLCEVS